MHDGEIDALTGLWNRRGLQRHLHEEPVDPDQRRQSRTPRWTSLTMLDLDGMKQINDELGHPVGDLTLVGFARALTEWAGDRALVARTGGDEFVVLSPHDPELVVELYGPLRDELRGGGLVAGAELPLTVSAGTTYLRLDAIDECLHEADAALWKSKAQGGARIELGGADALQYVDDRRVLLDRVRDMHDVIVRLLDETRTDHLTQIGNRRALDRHLEILERRADPQRVAMLFVDLDLFHEYNRVHSDHAGDEALQLVARTLQATSRQGDGLAPRADRPVFRKGGEEFLVAARVTTVADAEALGERLRAAVEGLGITHGAQDQPVLTVTIGGALTGPDRSPSEAVHDAAVVLTRLKNAGRRNVVEVLAEGVRPASDELPHETPVDDSIDLGDAPTVTPPLPESRH